jgi:hypothetical protein
MSADEIRESASKSWDDESSVESDLYDDLLTVEKKITELYQAGMLSEEDLKIIDCIRTRKPLRKLESLIDISRITLSDKFKKICERLAFFLGEDFSDSFYIRRLAKKYNLSPREVEILEKKIWRYNAL